MPSTFRDWLATFRQLHERAEQNTLPADQQAAYDNDRPDVLRALAVIQQLTVQPGQIPRRQPRVSRAVQVEITGGKATSHGITLDLSPGGFAMLMDRDPAVGSELSYRLHLPRGAPIAGLARVVDAKQSQGGSFRVACAFIDLTDVDSHRISSFVLSTALTRLSA
jgi:hypothetical protein